MGIPNATINTIDFKVLKIYIHHNQKTKHLSDILFLFVLVFLGG